MAGFKLDKDDTLIADINVTPFVDVILVLLIIFISTSTVIVRTALDLDIPVAANADQVEASPVLSILLNEKNQISLNGKAVNKTRLDQLLRQEVSRRKQKSSAGKKDPVQVLISARGEHPFQSVVDLIDLVKGTGVNGIALNTRVVTSKTLAKKANSNTGIKPGVGVLSSEEQQ